MDIWRIDEEKEKIYVNNRNKKLDAKLASYKSYTPLIWNYPQTFHTRCSKQIIFVVLKRQLYPLKLSHQMPQTNRKCEWDSILIFSIPTKETLPSKKMISDSVRPTQETTKQL